MRPAKGLSLVFALCFVSGSASGTENQKAGSLDFAGAAQLAVAASEELKSEQALRRIREGAWVLGRRAYLPQLSLSVSEDDRLSQIGSDSFLKNYSLNLDQLLWDGGRISTERAVERAELVLLGKQLERMAGEIAESALRAYRQVLSLRARIAIRRSAWESLDEQRRILSEEVALGLALPSDLAEADIAVAEAVIEIRSLELELRGAEGEMAELLGLTLLPELSERVDPGRPAFLPDPERLLSLVRARNPDLAESRLAIIRRQAEAKYAALSWLPTVRVNGGVGLSGQRYPLTKLRWSVGITVNFSSPYFSGGISGSAGWEPPYDQSARLQHTLSPLPDPASALTGRQAAALLALEQSRYAAAFKRAERLTALVLEKCRLAEGRRLLACEALELAAEKYRLAELRQELGRITRVELMEVRLEYAQQEILAVESAAALLEAERELERLVDLGPGELSALLKKEEPR
jgi:outer membrane protein TolC